MEGDSDEEFTTSTATCKGETDEKIKTSVCDHISNSVIFVHLSV